MQIRPEREADHGAIDAVVDAAFGETLESELVRAIRVSPGFVPDLSLVASVEDEIIGHVMFSRVTISGEADHDVLSLAPLAVHPDHQNRGVGTELTRAGIEAADGLGVPLIVVEGHPGYYPRFGFEPAKELGIEKPDPKVPDDAFMAIRMSRYDPAIRGRLIYSQPFYDLGAIGP